VQINVDGWLDEATVIPSPNCDPRPEGSKIELLVIHAISLPPGEFGGPHIQSLFQNRLDPNLHPYFQTIADLRVSAHFLIDRSHGKSFAVRLVRAAGVACWCVRVARAGTLQRLLYWH
jgi:N-acetyl-anhydromuramyl-L-alanine amidase AmpD